MPPSSNIAALGIDGFTQIADILKGSSRFAAFEEGVVFPKIDMIDSRASGTTAKNVTAIMQTATATKAPVELFFLATAVSVDTGSALATTGWEVEVSSTEALAATVTGVPQTGQNFILSSSSVPHFGQFVFAFSLFCPQE
jgi:hypothetical protein